MFSLYVCAYMIVLDSNIDQQYTTALYSYNMWFAMPFQPVP